MPVLTRLKEQFKQLIAVGRLTVVATDGNLTPDEIQKLLSDFVAKANVAIGTLADGLSFNDFLIIRDEFIPAVMQLVGVLNISGDQKKALVLSAVGMLFDSFAAKLILLTFTGPWAWIGWLLAIFLSPAIRPIVRNTFLSGASAVIEQVYDRLFRPVPALPPAV
ncbi:hypothetical protein NA78x_001758 [Anatilimnocola sp. NA78]|uniref:hypothetical protein n=1 Tax=Anatilimnocola sp. NA78 TaxID=3415683 RepID=UPI003CE45484